MNKPKWLQDIKNPYELYHGGDSYESGMCEGWQKCMATVIKAHAGRESRAVELLRIAKDFLELDMNSYYWSQFFSQWLFKVKELLEES